MHNKDIAQAINQLKQAQNDPQVLTVTTARIACDQRDPALFALLQTAAVPHWFDVPLLAHLLHVDADTASQRLGQLIQLPMVERYAARQAWNVHETTRLALRNTLASTDRNQFESLSKQCAGYYTGLEDFQRIENIYHRLSAGVGAGVAAGDTTADKQLLDLYHDWRRNGKYDTQQALALVLEELLESKLLKGVNLARTLVVRGWIRGSRLPLSQADAQARQAIALFIEAGDDYGEADAHDWLGNTLQTEGNLAEALKEYQAGMAIMQRLCERDPENSDWQRDLSVSHNKVGGVLQSQGNLTEALREYQAGMAIMQRLCERDPENSDWQRELSVSHNCVGSVLQSQGNLTEALREYQAYMAIIKRLCERDPKNSDWQRDLSVSHYLIATILETHDPITQDHLKEALMHREADLAIAERLAQRDTTNVLWQQDLQASRQTLEALKQRIKKMNA